MEIKTVTVVGGGLMGRQIALQTAKYDYQVRLYDAFPEAREAIKKWAEEYLAGRIAKGRMTEEEVAGIKSRFHVVDTMEEACKDTDLVIEAVPERLELKHSVLKQISDLSPETAIIGTNSSRLVSSMFIEDVKNPSRLCNVHYFNPALVMKCVEVVKGEHTSEEVAQACVEFAKNTGKTPCYITKEIDGFVVNRILMALKTEAQFLYQEGYASFQDIDTACENGLGHPMGPFKLSDLTGIDLQYDIYKRKYEETGVKPYCFDIFEQMVKEGRLGRKSGKGFYDYTNEKK